MSDTISAQITLFYLFDVADALTLATVSSLVGRGAVPNRLQPKSATPSYVQYQQPPIVVDGELLGQPVVGDFTLRVKPRASFVAENYAVFAITAPAAPVAGDALVEQRGDDIARLLRAERQPLSRQERDEVLRHRISYLAGDLVIPAWNAALVYDTPDGIQAALDILEFANSQLLEFRAYDDLLDIELARIYANLQRARPVALLRSRRYTRAAHAVHALLIDVHELTDHTENALKFVGDVYAARLFSLAAPRLGLDRWKASVQEKLDTLEKIHRFAVEQTSIARGEFLELTVICLIVLEVLLVLGH